MYKRLTIATININFIHIGDARNLVQCNTNNMILYTENELPIPPEAHRLSEIGE